MRQSERDKRNYLIIGLCAVLVVMAVGFAAFSQQLQINGTSNITSSWCVGFDTSKTTDYVATPGLSGATAPTASMSYNGNTCGSDNLQTGASLSASFKQPGDQVVYTFTIKNASSLNAKLDSIAENLTTSNSAIEYTLSGAKANDILGPNDTTTLVVTVKYKDSVTSQPEVTTWALELKLNFSQTNDSPIIPGYTGTIYSWSFDIPFAIYGSEASSWNDYNSSIKKLTKDNEYITEEDYPTYDLRVQKLSHQYYLKHDVVNDNIVASYLCFITDKENCMKGGSVSYYTDNYNILYSNKTWYEEQDNPYYYPGGCERDESYQTNSYYKCYEDGHYDNDGPRVYDNGNIGFIDYNTSGHLCEISIEGFSYCSG